MPLPFAQLFIGFGMKQSWRDRDAPNNSAKITSIKRLV
jgi:hypothetical protein